MERQIGWGEIQKIARIGDYVLCELPFSFLSAVLIQRLLDPAKVAWFRNECFMRLSIFGRTIFATGWFEMGICSKEAAARSLVMSMPNSTL